MLSKRNLKHTSHTNKDPGHMGGWKEERTEKPEIQRQRERGREVGMK